MSAALIEQIKGDLGYLKMYRSAECGFRRFSYSGSGRIRTAIPEVFVQA
jgi:hypothetical protein